MEGGAGPEIAPPPPSTAEVAAEDSTSVSSGPEIIEVPDLENTVRNLQAKEANPQATSVTSPDTETIPDKSIVQLAEETENVIGKSKENADGNKEMGEKLPAGESPIIPGKVANDPEFQKTLGGLYAQAGKEGEEIDAATIDKINEQALSDYYNESAKAQLEKGLPEEIKNDPLYNQKLGEATAKAQENGESLDGNKLSQEALANYKKEKDLQGEKTAESKTEQLTTDQQLEKVQQRIAAILEHNKDKLETAMVTVSAKDLVLLLKALSEAKEPDQKKKESKFMLLLKLLGVLVLSGITETGREINPVKS